MSRTDQITKRRGRSANNVSHSKRRTKTRKELNLQTKNILIDGRKVKFRVTAKTLKTITKLGIKKVLKKYKLKK
tara:strand:- start:92 stop:313 length:222 start_codon:yes stop_codon:yes gene_type:complete